MCLRRLGLELAAGGVKRPFAPWRAVAAPDVEPENSGSNSSRHRKTTKRKTQCCQSLRHLLLKRRDSPGLARLPQLGGHGDANPLIFRDRTPKGRHYRAADGFPFVHPVMALREPPSLAVRGRAERRNAVAPTTASPHDRTNTLTDRWFVRGQTEIRGADCCGRVMPSWCSRSSSSLFGRVWRGRTRCRPSVVGRCTSTI